MSTLYQFPFSHFCEKARWALDYKQHPYAVRNLLPLFHLTTTLRPGRKTSLPLLIEGDLRLQDSGEIIDYLDRRHPHKPLTPIPAEEARLAREWERVLDKDLGVTLRRWFYFHTLPDTPHARYFLEQDLPASRRHLFRLCFPLVRRAMQHRMRITPDTAASALDTLERTLDRLDTIVGGQPFLVGNHFSRADLTGAALLSPLRARGRTQEELQAIFSPPVWQWWKSFHQRPTSTWLEQMYRDYR
ncbi:glutathione S-transferase family protein [Paludibacterium paludis]|uniref:GST N-terminal domain-containing protein n=1 Tax=Paludibacterium paludis TaxID=1225769 RepID=A0A918P339_9NEIS|nr:glutathione S-transferase family protein [Paludibacterium paludis]GGY13704.1 hypothetical protein GCM10011289_16300 [Paludibacterium paludis]